MRSLLVLLAVAAAVYALLGLSLYLLQGSMVFLANVPGAAGTNTIQAIESGAQPKAFFRVAAKLPLTP